MNDMTLISVDHNERFCLYAEQGVIEPDAYNVTFGKHSAQVEREHVLEPSSVLFVRAIHALNLLRTRDRVRTPLAFAPLPPPQPYAEIVGLNLAARRVRRRVVSALWEAVEPGKSWDDPNASARVTALCRLADIYFPQSVPQQVQPPTVVMDYSPRALH